MRATHLLTLCAGVVLTGCGYIGEPQFPALNIPVRISDLGVVERGDHLMVYFTLPKLTTEGLGLKGVGRIDLRVGPTPGTEFHIEPWADNAQRFPVTVPAELGPVKTNVPVSSFIGKEVVVAVRVSNLKGRYSDWSNLKSIHVVAPLATPTELVARANPKGVLLTWEGPKASQYRIFRSTEKVPQPALLGTSDKPEYLDETTTYGSKYEYYVQATEQDVESEAAGPVSITPKDVFPPEVPAGVTATAGLKAIELAWERNTESDFKCYRVYRASPGGALELLADNVEAPNYSDLKVETGKVYRYAVSAVDQLGNESEKSPVVEATAP